MGESGVIPALGRCCCARCPDAAWASRTNPPPLKFAPKTKIGPAGPTSRACARVGVLLRPTGDQHGWQVAVSLGSSPDHRRQGRHIRQEGGFQVKTAFARNVNAFIFNSRLEQNVNNLEAGKRRLAGDTARAATSDEVNDLRRDARDLKEVVAEQTLELRLLKKSMTGDGDDHE